MKQQLTKSQLVLLTLFCDSAVAWIVFVFWAPIAMMLKLPVTMTN